MNPIWALTSVALGFTGLIFLGVFLTYVQSGGQDVIGLLERGAIYPFALAHILLGCGLLRARWLLIETVRMPSPSPGERHHTDDF
ncbi:hypothetical protein [Streptomyces sp. enrichment culture]|uniref:hypothetical protein n=1 Tax=Streptomyces sp. enrichment culture TaxID=1795815 RepID=UPI003F56F865